MAAAALNLVPVTLELGGRCPVVVGRSAHLARAVDSILLAKTLAPRAQPAIVGIRLSREAAGGQYEAAERVELRAAKHSFTACDKITPAGGR
jgi:hypothetical protein